MHQLFKDKGGASGKDTVLNIWDEAGPATLNWGVVFFGGVKEWSESSSPVLEGKNGEKSFKNISLWLHHWYCNQWLSTIDGNVKEQESYPVITSTLGGNSAQ